MCTCVGVRVYVNNLTWTFLRVSMGFLSKYSIKKTLGRFSTLYSCVYVDNYVIFNHIENPITLFSSVFVPHFHVFLCLFVEMCVPACCTCQRRIILEGPAGTSPKD
jgi:hypothetical protein